MPNVPIQWLKDHVEVLPGTNPEKLAADLVKVGLEEETIHPAQVKGPLVVGRVLTKTPEKQSNGKTINYCRVDVGIHNDAPGTGKEPSDLPSRSIICGAHNFQAGDLVAVILPGGILPGNFEIATRKTYGHISDGMICSTQELGLPNKGDGIIVLNEDYDVNELPGIGEDLIEFLGLGQELLEINVTPDRGYCFSMRGIAREYSHSTGAKYTDPGLAENYGKEIPEANESGFPVEVSDQAPIRGNIGCDRFVTRIVKGLNPQATSPKWLVERIEAMGMRSISLAVDATNYVMLDLGQPLHAYDLQQVTAPIVVRRALENEKLTTLDEVERNLDAEDLLITDSPNGVKGSRVLGLAGVMGGAETEVTSQTVDVLIEAAHFDSISVARSARRHRIPSEAAKRFERGVDPQLPAIAAQRVVDLLVEYGGATADNAVFDYNQVAEPTQILMPVSEPARLTGVNYPKERVIELLETIGATVKDQAENLLVTVPTWRPDITESCHLVEEVARLDGYDNITPILPVAPAGSGLPDRVKARRQIAQTLADRGFVQVLSYPFVGDAWDRCQIPENDMRRQAVKLRNPLVENQPYLRTSVLDSLLDIAQRNAARGAESIRVFELGMVTLPQGVKPAGIPSASQRPHPKEIGELHRGTPKQPWHLGMVLAGAATANNVLVEKRSFDWADILEVAKQIGAILGVKVEATQLYRPQSGKEQPKSVDTPAATAPWHPGRCANLYVRSGKRVTEVGRAGELHPRVVKNYGLPARAVALELDLETLFKLSSKQPIQVKPVSTFPVVKEDIAVVVAQEIPIADLLTEIRQAGGELLEEVALFDEYAGSQVEAGKRSLAFALRMRAADRTLGAEETAALRGHIMEVLAKKFDAKLRS
ncbi:phenylalanine--tRNA ligase subunit beta [Gleimia sp. 6138-11-ORH1]|uniref:phenylalanine--tRNA ligase subunit beta n=1 Tax=Gleimia sp. 6138-11-ORH1 TaxID=2973937 RepID=UPI0021680F29|nr:phenylalanine--tRNA ligase subunit beta [Gleimia sp. 6138-11-ORH1]MCS4484955.1 phenylalanine--tRNA ligase subunit beta [Gleimia sp. 6138-11-ORH1]